MVPLYSITVVLDPIPDADDAPRFIVILAVYIGDRSVPARLAGRAANEAPKRLFGPHCRLSIAFVRLVEMCYLDKDESPRPCSAAPFGNIGDPTGRTEAKSTLASS